MKMAYGSFPFPVNGFTNTSRTEIVRSKSGRPVRWRSFVDVTASYIAPPGQGTLTLSNWELQVRAALSVPYQTLNVTDDNDVTLAVSLIPANSISGVVIVDGPHFPEPSTPEWVKTRTVRFTGMAEYVFRGAESALISYTESVSLTGTGGPVRRWRVPVNDYGPIRQQVTRGSVVRLVQSGVAVGHLTWPAPPAYLWPVDLIQNESAGITYETGQPVGRAWVEHVTRWQFIYENSGILPALPNLPAM